LNNGKSETIKLIDEINKTNDLFGKKTDWETEKYEEQYLQEISPKEYCVVM